MRSNSRLIGVASLAVWLSGSGANAASLLPADLNSQVCGTHPFSASCVPYPGDSTVPGTISNGIASITTGLVPSPFISLSADGSQSGTANGWMTYYFELDGPLAGVVVPVDVNYKLSVSIGGSLIGNNAFVESEIRFFETGTGAHNQDLSLSTGTQTINGTAFGTVYSGSVNSIYIHAESLYPSTGVSTALVDPTIFIDPSFAQVDPNYLNDYSFSFSPGVGNSAGTIPEPAVWTTMLLGFFGVGFMLRRTRNASALATV